MNSSGKIGRRVMAALLFCFLSANTPACVQFQASPYDTTTPEGLFLLSLLLSRPFEAYALGQSDVNSVADLRDGLNSPREMALVGGRLFVADSSNNRVLIWNSPPTSTRTPPDVVLGQPDHAQIAANTRGLSARSLSSPQGVSSDGTRLVVADSNNARVLIWNTIPTADFTAADIVLGQGDFISSGTGTSSTQMLSPRAAIFCGGRLYVSDTTNNRIMIWNNGSAPGNGLAADGALGQANHAGSGGSTGAGGLNRPHGLACDGVRLAAADFNNNRVLIWNTIPAGFATAADIAVGQIDLTANGAAVSVSGLTGPRGVAIIAGALYVADESNNRVLRFNTIPGGSGANADLVLGQATFGAAGANAGGAGLGLASPAGIAGDGTGIYVSEQANHRVAIWANGVGVNHQAVDAVLGQVDTTTLGGMNTYSAANPNFLGLAGISGFGERIFAADDAAHRIMIWKSIPESTSQSAALVVGQSDFSGLTMNGPGISSGLNQPKATFFDGTRFFVSDSGNNRILIWNTLPGASGTSADLVLGQASLATAGLGTAANLFNSPYGIYSNGSRVFTTEIGNSRGMVWDSFPGSNQQAADLVLGQPNFGTSGTAAGTTGMSGPVSIHSDGTRLFVADLLNHRVLIWNTLPAGTQQPADVVLGQPDFASNQANHGATSPDARSLNNPIAVFAHDERLFVVDGVNNRVLIWDSIPTANFQAADQVVGQPDFASSLANNGGLNASGLNTPVGVYVHEERLYIADRGNRRVLVLPLPAP